MGGSSHFSSSFVPSHSHLCQVAMAASCRRPLSVLLLSMLAMHGVWGDDEGEEGGHYMDKDKDGKITWDEMESSIHDGEDDAEEIKERMQKIRKLAEDHYKKADENADGFLDKSEHTAFT